MSNIFICVNKEKRITSLYQCSSIIVVDTANKKIVEEISIHNIRDIHDLEILGKYFDIHDPYILFTCNSNEEMMLGIEEYGVHVYIVKCIHYNDLLNEFYGFKV